ncbi:vesicle-associated protein 2-2-like [Oryza brachyantha]|uniref:MSP domain-containing protein n=1 Tax=Oryza brachyantha TaxID=4533 RepID=J3L7M3_ORYBR|nr:vesicle-associated protein 2-2-like [Oryza brachyantha]
MGQDLAEIHPRELQFTFEVKKQSSCTVHLVNKSNEYVAFKVKTTSPKRYCVRPNTGVILPRSTCDFTVTMQAQRTAPPDMQLKDKFLVQTTVVPYGTSDEDLVPSFFSKETGRYIEESKLRVVLVSASHPFEEQPTNGIPNTEAAVEVPLKEVLNVRNEVPVTEREVHPPLETDPVIIPAPHYSVKEAPILREVPVHISPVRETPILREVPAPVSPVRETPIPREAPAPVSPVKETAILREVPTPLKETPVILTESPPPPRDTPSVTVESIHPLEQNLASLKESPLEETLPKAAVILSEQGAVNVQSRQLSHVTEDVQNLKSKLNNLELKLEEAGKMIIKLREESRTTTQERDKLQQEMVFLRKKGTPRSQVGFPLLFVVYVALLGTSLGYLLRL